jgi:hypothetical protein
MSRRRLGSSPRAAAIAFNKRSYRNQTDARTALLAMIDLRSMVRQPWRT